MATASGESATRLGKSSWSSGSGSHRPSGRGYRLRGCRLRGRRSPVVAGPFAGAGRRSRSGRRSPVARRPSPVARRRVRVLKSVSCSLRDRTQPSDSSRRRAVDRTPGIWWRHHPEPSRRRRAVLRCPGRPSPLQDRASWRRRERRARRGQRVTLQRREIVGDAGEP